MATERMKVLVVDDDEDIRTSLREILDEEGYEPVVAATLEEGRERSATGVDLALVDIKLDDRSGIELLRDVRESRPWIPVIMISGHGTVALAAEAFKLGAHDFMEKPLRLVKVRACVRNALEAVSLKHRLSKTQRDAFPRPVYRSESMKNLYRQVSRLARVSEPVVILGPSGSGKELVARALHTEGGRVEGEFVATNSAAMPVTLAEDELFGHEKGAFTGAHARRVGCIERAHGGTLFLDEIADMDPQIQAKLLRVLETGTLMRLGGTETIRVNVRIVAATHNDPEKPVAAGTFRRDLWYRLSAFVLRVPPLSARKDDIGLLAKGLLERVRGEMGLKKRFSAEGLAWLEERDYPGNVRELRHIVTRAAVLSDGEVIDREVLEGAPVGMSLGDSRGGKGLEDYLDKDFRTARAHFERDYLRQALDRHEGNITATAAAIGMAQSNLSRKLKEIGLK